MLGILIPAISIRLERLKIIESNLSANIIIRQGQSILDFEIVNPNSPRKCQFRESLHTCWNYGRYNYD